MSKPVVRLQMTFIKLTYPRVKPECRRIILSSTAYIFVRVLLLTMEA
jgi:hypothetical protein